MSRIITSRMRWCINKIQQCFDVESRFVEDALKDEENYDALKNVLADTKKPAQRVFIYYQPTYELNPESNEWVQTSQESELVFTDGSDPAISFRGKKGCYFLRTTNKDIDLEVACDDSLLFGEIGSDPLKSLELSLSRMYKPLCDTRADWGKAESEQKSEFLESCSKVSNDLQDSIKSLMGGLELKKPDRRFDAEGRNISQRSKEDQELVQHFEELLEDWCNVIEEYLSGDDHEGSFETASDSGPMTELEYWRRRMQRLTNVMEQLKQKECKNVIGILTSLTKNPQDGNRQKNLFSLLRRWKQNDINITEAANEAKDNVKYLFTLEKFIEPLYSGKPWTIIDTIPALMNSIKMIHTIARYYNTTDRMTGLFFKITNEMITNCKNCVLNENSSLWEQDPEKLVKNLEACLRLNEAYQENYRLTKDKLLTMPKGKQFDFNEQQIFGKFDLFCRRVVKLIEMFSTIHQFNALAMHKLEGMEDLIKRFQNIIQDFKTKNHDLLDFHSNKFDRDFVAFNVSISELEGSLQQFINESFESITSIESSLNLLKKFQTILQRDNLKSDLDSKFNIIFQNYGLELEIVQQLYEKHKHSPPIPRNLPPVSGNIMWSRHLLKRIEEPMKKFESNQNVLSTKDAKRIIKTYNKVARTLVAFEYLWFQAWQQSIETAKAGLQATLIIRHPDDDRLYVNFDQEILQLIREAKCLDRMGIDVPESAKIVLLQESKFKSYYNDLAHALKEYDRVVKRVIPVATKLLGPHMRDMEYKLRPGMITLTWTSMNIDAYKHHIHSGLKKLEELVTNINDLIENRIEKNLRIVSKCVLVDLPTDKSTQLNDFVVMQERRIEKKSKLLSGKNIEIENAVNDLIELVCSFPLDPHVEPISEEEIQNVKNEYRHKMYCALLKCTKSSLNMIKERVGSKGPGGGFLFIERPFFEIFVNLQTPKVQITPDLDDVQKAINKSALAVLKCSKYLYDWDQDHLPEAERVTFFDEITCDLQIAVVALLLTGSIQGLKTQVLSYLDRFYEYEWLWSEDKDRAYAKFMAGKPSLAQYEQKLLEFQEVDQQINAITSIHVIGAMSINTSTLKNNLRYEVQTWKLTFSKFLHNQAQKEMESLYEYMKQTEQRLKRGENIKNLINGEKSSSNSDVLQELSKIMEVLKEIRERESGIELEIVPVIDKYDMLERFIGSQSLGDEENDQKEVLRHRWEALVDYAERVTDELGELQESFKRRLLRDIKEFVNDVVVFRNDFVANGPMVAGIKPKVAVDRLRRFHDDFEIRDRKYKLYRSGEELFALRPTEYPELVQTEKELALLDTLYDLYVDVIDTLDDWKQIEWEKVRSEIDAMNDKVEGFAGKCKKMPIKLREWDAYKDLKKQIDDFQVVLPLLQALAKPSVMQRHWTEVSRQVGTQFVVGPEFRLGSLLEADLVQYKEDIEEICDGADKQLSIQNKMGEIAENWQLCEFQFMNWKSRGIPVFKLVGPIVEDLEEAQMQLQTMITMRHVTPFKDEAIAMLNELSDTAETLDRWVKVQMLWCSLESVFTGGDIAKQLPLEAKKFQKIDKDFDKVMHKAQETSNVLQCCQNDILKQNLMVFYNELEQCQKSLEGYLEQKRSKFPRFYFVSNPVLLQILSQGSDPLAVQPFYEKIFDSIAEVVHEDKNTISGMFSRSGADNENITLSNKVQCKGNIEEWLMTLLHEQQNTMKNITRECAARCGTTTAVDQLRGLVDDFPGQFALLAIQLIWTSDCSEALSLCKQKKTAMKECNDKALSILTELSSWCLTDLGTKMNRTKIETLVTIQVHQRDVMSELFSLYKQKQISDPNDFEWQKQARFQWRPQETDAVDENGSLVISVTDVDFKYSYEYLGCTERLVITPLTDRCYITLAQALGMCFGGAPAGPAGTGKTETVKDMGRALGIFVMVQNCTDQMSYKDCAKIFKGLCQGGLWGCFDEFNRITLPVLSVVAQQVLAIQTAKKQRAKTFTFPGDPTPCLLNPVCGFFITMNPGYAGRQELPENLKALFRGVAMMVPDRMIIMKVKLCSVGYKDFTVLAKKFAQLYKLCEEQLSQQKHYDFGLRNILSVLRTCGANKRANLDKPEEFLMYRTLRDMNLSKFVAQDVPLFLSLLSDLFPKTKAPPVSEYPDIEKEIALCVDEEGLILHPTWRRKIVQLYETYLVRHGIMMVGPTGGGKSQIINTLSSVLAKTTGTTFKINKINPKAIRAAEMYGEADPVSGEWTTGVFAAMWAKMNQRANKYSTWLVCDGPVDAIWIEDLNTVLDDNKILTLANGDRFPMTDQNKILFEVESLRNASPATVSRAGIIYVSDTDLDWEAVGRAWLKTRNNEQSEFINTLFKKWIGECTPTDPGFMFTYMARGEVGKEMIQTSRIGKIAGLLNLLTSLLSQVTLNEETLEQEQEIERLFVFSLVWSIGANLESEGREKFDEYLRSIDSEPLPGIEEEDAGTTVYEFTVDLDSLTWVSWSPEEWEYPSNAPALDFSNLLVPTMDSTRANFVLDQMHRQRLPVMMVGGPGTAKTSTALMYFNNLDPATQSMKRINFSSATTMFGLQSAVEDELEKRGGKNFGPASGKKMTIFLDDLSMPLVNDWGDQPTLELARQLIETGSFAFLDKDKRGELKVCEDLQYVAAMGHPGGGKNDIPNRLKRHFLILNMVLPSITSINDIYGQMLNGRFPEGEFSPKFLDVVGKLTRYTIQLWQWAQRRFLPTPKKFHYIFNMRDVSRVFQGILLCPKETLLTGGINTPCEEQDHTIIKLWKHECERVFCDKLVDESDKLKYLEHAAEVLSEAFGEEASARIKEDCKSVHHSEANENTSPVDNVMDELVAAPFVSFLRDDIYDEETEELLESAPKLYEPGGDLSSLRDRITMFMLKQNVEYPSEALKLVLFDDALGHLLRISRVLCMPRGSALLVGVGGSGKQSLTRLASYIAGNHTFQVTLTKQYSVSHLLDDIRELYRIAGQERRPVTFLFTDQDIKEEGFLETINTLLMTGEIPGLFSKEEMLGMTSDLEQYALKERPGFVSTPASMRQYFFDSCRDNLHLVLCMSPVNPKFPERARKFPGLINCCTIDWFLRWPEQALKDVAKGFINDYNPGDVGMYLRNEKDEQDDAIRSNLMDFMGTTHEIVVDICTEYQKKMKRNVYQTPKSYLSFISHFMTTYETKLLEINDKEERISLGLRKLIQGASDVEDMKLVLKEEEVKLKQATEETNKMIVTLERESAEAKKESDKVAVIQTQCEADAKRIGLEKEACEEDLAKAMPFVTEATRAIDSINPSHINEVKKLSKPSDIIKLVFDGVLILFQKPLDKVQPTKLSVKKEELEFIKPSYDKAKVLMNDVYFLKKLQQFGGDAKDNINDETIELMMPYLDLANFNSQVAKSASAAAEGLCTWVVAMKNYTEASKIVKPKLESLALSTSLLNAAERDLGIATEKLEACKERLARMQDEFDKTLREKARIEEGAAALKKKMNQASSLIDGLSGERRRWSEDKERFAEQKRKLVGDVAIACAFVSYCGPFNQDFRNQLINVTLIESARNLGVPVSDEIDPISFLTDVATIGDWNLQGLPSDPLSIQNGILVTKSSRYPLLIDPQGQAIAWITARETQAERMPAFGVVQLNNPKLKDNLEYAMGDGLSLIVAGVEEEIDPILDPVLEKQIIKKGRSLFINVADKMCPYQEEFNLYFITRLPNPHFSPELQAKTTIVDFTVTLKGLEDQLLGRVIGKEQKALQDQLEQVQEEVAINTRTLMEENEKLLNKLTSNTGSLLDDTELIGVLKKVKDTAEKVTAKLNDAAETKTNINEKREQYRPVATRGAVLYFSIVETSTINVMYQTSLQQFLNIFMKSMDEEQSAKNNSVSKRVANIIEALTYLVYRYVNRGLYEADKLTFVLIVTVKILITAGDLNMSDLTNFLRGGASLDLEKVRKKPFPWLADDVWLNIMALSNCGKFFASLPDDISRSEDNWKCWYEDNNPEQLPIPDYEDKLAMNPVLGAWYKLQIVRSLRMDRTIISTREFIRNTPQMGSRYVEPVTDIIESIYQEMDHLTPVIYLLSVGADPTDAIQALCSKKKKTIQVVSMGQGQEPVAVEGLMNAMKTGNWLLLQNCELGLGLMNEMEERLKSLYEREWEDEEAFKDFRLFITAAPHPEFPLGLLQMCMKVTNEPPAGLRAGMLRSYTVLVDQDRMERVEAPIWRQTLFNMCFIHSIVQERRKYGPLGWCIPYEYNTGDITACILFLEKHLYSASVSWPTIQYMVSEVQYGGKITDDIDRRLFSTYAECWMAEKSLSPDFTYNPETQIEEIKDSFRYCVPNKNEHSDYVRFIQGFPEDDSPEIFGLHPNADLTYRINSTNSLLTTLGETQPKDAGGADDGPTLDEIVKEKCAELLATMPSDFNMEDVKQNIIKQGGMGVPLNIFLFQETQIHQEILAKVRFDLVQLQAAIEGDVVMTNELQQAMLDIFEAKVPNMWVWTIGGDEFSWLSSSITKWFESLYARIGQFKPWLTTARPNSFWLAGFKNPNGFLTAMKQEVTRQHKADGWALDDIVYHTEVAEFENGSLVRAPPKEGVYIHGLFLEGAAWEGKGNNGTLVESEPKKLYAPLPVLYMTAVTKKMKADARSSYGPYGPYECPIYKYTKRTDRYIITVASINTREQKPSHWILRGAALLCNIDS